MFHQEILLGQIITRYDQDLTFLCRFQMQASQNYNYYSILIIDFELDNQYDVAAVENVEAEQTIPLSK